MATEDKELKNIKSFLRSVLITAKDGVPAYSLQSKKSFTSSTFRSWILFLGK